MTIAAKYVDLTEYNVDLQTARHVVSTAAIQTGLEARHVSRDGVMIVGDQDVLAVFLLMSRAPELPVLNYVPDQVGDTDDDL